MVEAHHTVPESKHAVKQLQRQICSPVRIDYSILCHVKYCCIHLKKCKLHGHIHFRREVTDRVNDLSSSSESSSSGASADYSQNRTGHNYQRSTSPAFSLGSQGRSTDTGESSDSSHSTVDYSKKGEGEGTLHYIT